MKIIYISHWRFPSEKTMSPLIMKTCEMFARSGMRVELWVPRRNNFSFSHQDPFAYHNIQKNFLIRRLPVLDLTGIFPGDLVFLLMVATFNISTFICFTFRGLAPDSIIYFHDARDALLPIFLKRKSFLEIHDFYKSKINFINGFIFTRIKGFIVTNRLKAEKLKAEFGVPEKAILHRPNGVDVKMFALEMSQASAREKLGLPLDPKIVLYTGHLFDWKGVDTLFEAHKFLEGEEVIYFVGGTDKDIQKYRQMVQKFPGAQKCIVVAGRRSHAEIPLWLKAADVLVLPNTAKSEASKYETSPVKLFEYMASKIPIVASDLPSIRNVVDEGMVWFVRPDDPRALANCIHKIWSDQTSAISKALRAQREVAQYSWENRNEAIIKFMRSMI